MIKLLSAVALVLAVPAAAQEAPPVAPTTPASSSLTTAPAAPAVLVAPAAPVAPTLTAAQIHANEVVCKTEQETGSLVKKHKTCLTRKQWAYVNDQHESYARKMVDDNMGRPPGGP